MSSERLCKQTTYRSLHMPSVGRAAELEYVVRLMHQLIAKVRGRPSVNSGQKE